MGGSLPDVLSFLIADSVFQQRSGKWCVIGIFDRIRAPAFPVLHHSLGLFLQLAEVTPGEHELRMVLRDSGGGQIAASPPMCLSVREQHDPVNRIYIGMQTHNLMIPHEGTYFIEVLFDGSPLPADIRLTAEKVRPPGA